MVDNIAEHESENIIKNDREPTPDDDQLADIVIGKIKPFYRYFHSSWHFYTDGYWKPVKNIYEYILKVLRDNRRLGIKPSRAKSNSVEFFVQNALEIPDETVVDNYPNLFNVRNGLFNLQTLKLQKHDKNVLVTAQAGFAYNPKAQAPNFKKWLSDMLVYPLSEQTDWNLINLVQEMMGYCLTGDTSHRVSFWIVGASRTGKSTLVNLMVKMAKSYHTTIDLNQLATNRFLLARMAGKRLITSIEASAGVKLEDGIYKTLVSDDVVLADVKNKEPIEFVPQGKIVWAMNNLPYLSDRSGAIDSRVVIIPMARQIPRDEWDLELDEKLALELAGIFNFALEGLARLRRQGFFTPVAQSEKMSSEYRKMQDIYQAFLEDEQWCQLDGKTQATPLYKAFCSWASENGIRHVASKISIAREWERLGLDKIRSNQATWYHGIELTSYATKSISWS
jgi:putative DNA primase/helicase